MKVSEALNLYSLHNKPEQLNGYEAAQKYLARPADILVFTSGEDTWFDYYPSTSLLAINDTVHWLAGGPIANYTDLKPYTEKAFFAAIVKWFSVGTMTMDEAFNVDEMKQMLRKMNPTHFYRETGGNDDIGFNLTEMAIKFHDEVASK